MRKVEVFLTRDWIDARLAEFSQPGVVVGAQADADIRWAHEARHTMRRCEMEHAGGAGAAVIRGLCRQFVERLIPIAAKERLGQTMPRAWVMAAVGGDPVLAKAIAAPYAYPDAAAMSAQWQIREAMLRHALAGDEASEAALASRLKPGYMADFPPDLIEFPLAVHRRDPAMLAAAVKKTATTFKGKWDAKKHRAWYDKQLAKYPTGSRSPGTWEQFMDRTKRDLFSHQYVLAWWALAWLNVGRWRGVTVANEAVFSEFVPATLAR